EAAGALAGVRVEHRLEAICTRGGYTVVDDSYNASPESMLAAFELLTERPRSGRLLALLGEMRELGQAAPVAHESIGRRARDVFAKGGVGDLGPGGRWARAAGATCCRTNRRPFDGRAITRSQATSCCSRLRTGLAFTRSCTSWWAQVRPIETLD